jgi:tetratricopeptide (TPR) repeat protein
MHPAPPAHTLPPPSWRRGLFVALGFAFVLLAVYWPALHGGLVWDDDAHLTRADLRPLAGLERIWFEPGATQQYYPLLHSAFWLEHRLWGDDPAGYHLLNLLLHAGAAVLVGLILRRLAVPGAALAAAVFALHPVMVESVAWISEQKNTLSAVFELGALFVYLRFDVGRRRRDYALATALFGLALLSKTVAAMLPVVLLVLLWWRRGRLEWRRDVLPLAPWLAAGGGAGLFTAWVERVWIGAQGPAFALGGMERLLLAGRAPWFYFAKLLWPTGLTFIYPRWGLNPADGWQWLFPAATVATLACLVWWAGRRPTGRAALAGGLVFLAALFPALGFFAVYPFRYSFVADHFQYLASLGVLVPVVAGLAGPLARWRPLARAVGVGAILGPLAWLTWRQSHVFAGEEALCHATMAQNPGWAHNTLGIDLLNLGHLDEAVAQFQQALQARPDYVDAHNDLGIALFQKGRTDEAVAQFQQALLIEPDYADAHYNLAIALLQKGRTGEAISQYQHALQIRPFYWEALNNLALLLATLPQASLRDGHKAVELARQAEQITGEDNPVVLGTLAAAYAESGRFPEATATARRAVQLAAGRHNDAMAATLQAQLNLYQAGGPLRDLGAPP